jgi:hydroxyethylthiazole kinase-like uncharacterized protein yjeF
LIELLTTEEMGRADRLTIDGGTPGRVLMERAGRAVAAIAAEAVAPGGAILVLCGPGNNGGDGFVAARVLAGRGFDVRVCLLGEVSMLRGDAALMAAAWEGPLEPPSKAFPEAADVVIDALFGAGLSRDLEGEARLLVERTTASGTPVLAVDVPSGLDGDTGRVRGAAVGAFATVTFFRKKPGHLLEPGRSLCGRITVVDIGIAPGVLPLIGPSVFENAPSLWPGIPSAPDPAGHKYGRGHVLVRSGGLEGCGAARLAARAALRIGAGLVTVGVPSEGLVAQASALTATMVRRADGPAGFEALLEDRRRNVVVIGPAAGAGEATRKEVGSVLRSGKAAVLDADALTSFSGRAAELAAAIKEVRRPVVLTPHEGEYHSLMRGMEEKTHIKSKLDRVRRAAAHLGGVVVLKGPDTVIAAPDGRAAINANGSPLLATAGSGDVLAGMVAGLIAQGAPAFEAACAGVFLHAECARAFGPGLIAEDLPEMLPRVLSRFI